MISIRPLLAAASKAPRPPTGGRSPRRRPVTFRLERLEGRDLKTGFGGVSFALVHGLDGPGPRVAAYGAAGFDGEADDEGSRSLWLDEVPIVADTIFVSKDPRSPWLDEVPFVVVADAVPPMDVTAGYGG